MTREIKFRAWDKNNNHMLYQSHDQILELGEGQHEDMLNIWLNGTIEITNSERNYFPIDRFILQQYTGLKDKNGKEIYEGDIVKGTDPRMRAFDDIKPGEGLTVIGEVLYNESYGAFDFLCPRTRTYLRMIVQREVIGNKYENPELLKENNNERRS